MNNESLNLSFKTIMSASFYIFCKKQLIEYMIENIIYYNILNFDEKGFIEMKDEYFINEKDISEFIRIQRERIINN